MLGRIPFELVTNNFPFSCVYVKNHVHSLPARRTRTCLRTRTLSGRVRPRRAGAQIEFKRGTRPSVVPESTSEMAQTRAAAQNGLHRAQQSVGQHGQLTGSALCHIPTGQHRQSAGRQLDQLPDAVRNGIALQSVVAHQQPVWQLIFRPVLTICAR